MKSTHTLLRLALAPALCAALLSAAQAAPVVTSPAPALADGFRVDWAQVDAAPHSVSDALNALDGTGGATVLNRSTQYLGFVGVNDASVPFAGADPTFAVRVSGFITLGGGSYRFLSFHDDGLRIRVGGETVVLYDADTATRADDSAVYTLAAGVYAYEAISWEQGGAFVLDLGIDDGSIRAFLPGQHAAVPEPSALLLTGLALAGLGWQRRRRSAA